MPQPNSAIAPFARPLYVMLKPAGAACNLRCDYCYYLDKKELYPGYRTQLMSDELLDKFTRQYLESQTMSEVMFTWHGGETLLRSIDFYRKALALQKKYARGRRIDNSLQTNGTLLTDEWCNFFREHNFLIGISVDGTREMHDRYRKNAEGKTSFDKVLQGVELLQKHGVEFNIMATVNDYNVDYPLEFYRYLKTLSQFIQFTPIVERFPNGEVTPWSVPSEKWGKFLCDIFDEWVRSDVGQIFVQYFDSTLANWMGVAPGVCTLAKTCGHAGVMEFNGDVYSCDHFVFPEYKLGNIHSKTLTAMMYSDRQQQFGQDKYNKLPAQCRACKFLFACNGECPKNRIAKTAEGEEGLSYLCQSYYEFFEHVAPYMELMKKELEAKRSPANIMRMLRENRLNP